MGHRLLQDKLKKIKKRLTDLNHYDINYIRSIELYQS